VNALSVLLNLPKAEETTRGLTYTPTEIAQPPDTRLTMSESVLGLRHGPMAALDPDTLFVCFLSGDPKVQKYELDLLEEIGNKRLARSRVVVAGTGNPSRNLISEYFLAPVIPFPAGDDYSSSAGRDLRTTPWLVFLVAIEHPPRLSQFKWRHHPHCAEC
jgi:hypothetical protein